MKIKIMNEDKKCCNVRDHRHYTGKCREAADNICNLRYKIPKEIPVVFHNGSKYDYNFIIKNQQKNFNDVLNVLEKTQKNIQIFSTNKEKT